MVPESPTAKESADSVPDISSDETIYRRCVTGWFKEKTRRPSIMDFMPRPWKSDDHPGDFDGLSVARSRLTEPDAVSTCPIFGTLYHVAELEVRFIQGLDLTVEKKPLPHDRAHAVIPELNSLARRDADREAWMDERAKKLRDKATMVHIVKTA